MRASAGGTSDESGCGGSSFRMAVIVSEVLGIPVDQLDVTWANTDRDAWTFVTDASRSCHCDGKAVYNAAKDCVRQLVALGARQLGASESQLEVRGGDGRLAVSLDLRHQR